MNLAKSTIKKTARRAARTRAKIFGTAERPRLSVFRSNKGIYCQLIDDEKGLTLASVYGSSAKDKTKKTALARKMGEAIAKKAAELKIANAIFDRGSYQYHGRVKEVAEGARAGGLKF